METSVELTSNESITEPVIYKNTVPDEYKSDIKWIENVEPLFVDLNKEAVPVYIIFESFGDTSKTKS